MIPNSEKSDFQLYTMASNLKTDMENDKDQQTDELLEIAKRFEKNLKLESPKRDTLVNKMKLAKPVMLGSPVTPKVRMGSPRLRGVVTDSAVYVTSSGFATTNTMNYPENFPNQATPNQESQKMMKIPENTSQSQVKNLSWKSKRWDTTTKHSKAKTVYLKPK